MRTTGSSSQGLFGNRKFLGADRLRGNFGWSRRRGGPCRRRLNGRLGRMRVFEHRSPLIGEVDLFLNTGGLRGSTGLDRLGAGGFGSHRCCKLKHGFFADRLGLGGDFHRGDFRDGCRGSFLLGGRGTGCQLGVGKTGGALESAAKLAEALGAAQVGTVDVDLLKLGSKLSGAAVVAGTEDKVEKFLKGWRVARSAAQNGFEKADSFLRETVAGEKVDVGEGLGDELLGLLVELRLGGCGDGGGFVANDGSKSGF